MWNLKKFIEPSSVYQEGYQQALADFGIKELLAGIHRISACDFEKQSLNLTEQERESLAALLIQQLKNNLKDLITSSYLNLLRNTGKKIISDIPPIELNSLQSPTALPENFPQQMKEPIFKMGTLVRWIPLSDETETDTGIIIGYFLAYARHRGNWVWKYLVKLTDSQNRVVADTAWEQDLELIEGEAI